MILEGPIEKNYGNFSSTRWYVSGGRWNGWVDRDEDGIFSCDCLQYQKYGKESHRCVHIDQVSNALDKS